MKPKRKKLNKMDDEDNTFRQIYNIFLKEYGRQGWWPLLELENNPDCSNPTKSGSMQGYHPGDYDYPNTERQRFEICLGAILTQNTSWPNVEKALKGLEEKDLLTPEKILSADEDKVKQSIRPAGYFNQKAKKLKIFSEYYTSLDKKSDQEPTREELLELWGIGPETADSILLYAYKKEHFVVDAYTRRIFSRLGLVDDRKTYEETKKMFEDNLSKDTKIYQEYHALLVEHAKRYCNPKPRCEDCIIDQICKKICNKKTSENTDEHTQSEHI